MTQARTNSTWVFIFPFSFLSLSSDVLKRVLELALLLTAIAFLFVQFLNMWKANGFARVPVLQEALEKILLGSICEI